MRFGSLFSGIGGIDLGLERAGMECQWQVEIDAYRCEVLARHWPNVRRYEDVRDCGDAEKPSKARKQYLGQLGSVDLICGGFPCQDVSTAGKRAGLRAERSGLFFEFARIVGELRPKWFLVENVPGLYSSNAGKDFDTVIGTLAELGYGLAWRVLDSQYFGVPQRRRRVFIVGRLGGPCPPAVLFEREGGEGDSQKGGKAGETIAHSLRASPRGVDEHTGTTYICETAFTGANQDGWREGTTYPVSPTQAVCAPPNPDRVRETSIISRRLDGGLNDVDSSITAANARDHRNDPSGRSDCDPPPVRKRFGTSANNIQVRLRDRRVSQDSRRYAALGDAVTVNVAEWIGKRIMAVEWCTP